MLPGLRGIAIAAGALFVLSSYYPAFAKLAETSSMIINFNGPADKNNIPKPWHLKLQKGRADIGIIPDDHENILHIQCRDSSFAIERDFPIVPDDFPYLTWTWKAVQLPPSGDLRKRGHNDQALQLLVAFENRKIISYVWDSNAPEGTISDESLGWPINLAIKVIVVKSGTADTGKWVMQSRHAYDDYKNLFHEEPPRIKGIRIQANTQYTKESSEGYIRSIVFSRGPGKGN